MPPRLSRAISDSHVQSLGAGAASKSAAVTPKAARLAFSRHASTWASGPQDTEARCKFPDGVSSVLYSPVHPGRPGRLKLLERLPPADCGTVAIWCCPPGFCASEAEPRSTSCGSGCRSSEAVHLAESWPGCSGEAEGAALQASWPGGKPESPERLGSSRPGLLAESQNAAGGFGNDSALWAIRKRLLHSAKQLDVESRHAELTLSACRQLLCQVPVPAPAPLLSKRRTPELGVRREHTVSSWAPALDIPNWDRKPVSNGTIFAPSCWLHPQTAGEEIRAELSGEPLMKHASSRSSSKEKHDLPQKGLPIKKQWTKVKSIVFMKQLNELRRNGGRAKPTGVEEELEENPNAHILGQTLGDVHDSSAILTERRLMLEESLGQFEENGGDRHPTVILFKRCLTVVDRKLGLLSELEEKCAAYEALLSQGDALWENMFAGQSKANDIIGNAINMRNFLKEVVHDGDPQEADKSDFAFFVSHLGLPPGHDMLVKSTKVLRRGIQASCQSALDVFARKVAGLPPEQARELSISTTEAVQMLLNLSVQPKHTMVRQLKAEALKLRARYVLHMAKQAASLIQKATIFDGPQLLERAGEIKTMITEALEFGVPLEAEEIKQANLMLHGLRANTVLQNARFLQQSDADRPDNRKAVHSAAAIREECIMALEFGVLANDPVLAQARYIAATLHAVKVLRIARTEQAEDTQATDKHVYLAGDATAAADRIDADIKEALQAMVPRDHPMLEEARGIAKYLREQEFMRKRMLASVARRVGKP